MDLDGRGNGGQDQYHIQWDVIQHPSDDKQKKKAQNNELQWPMERLHVVNALPF